MQFKIFNSRLVKLLLCLVLFCVLALVIYPTGYFVLSTPISSLTQNFAQNKVVQPKKVLLKKAQESPLKEVGAYIINLDRCKARYDYVKNNVHNLGIPVQRISAVDGNQLSQIQLEAVAEFDTYYRFLNQYPKKGTIGCSLSHIKAWQTFLESNFEYALIFEDDVSFMPEKLKPVITQLVEHNQYWDINNFESYHHGVPLTIKNLKNNQKLVVYLTNVTHTGAYMINRNAAQQLLAKALPIKMPIDHYFTRVWEFGLTFRGVENPRLVYQSYGTSEIAQSNVVKTYKRTKISAPRLLYQMKTGIIRTLYNFNCYLKSFFEQSNSD